MRSLAADKVGKRKRGGGRKKLQKYTVKKTS
jgi:hypothetical protein